MGKLSISLGSLPVLAFEIGTEPVRVGRSTDNDLVLPLPDVADFHAEVQCSGSTCEVRALQGESVQHHGCPVAQARLSSGDRIALGGYRLQWLSAEIDPEHIQAELDADHARSHGTKPLQQPRAHGGRVTGVEVMDGPERGLSLALPAAAIVVGRSLECEVALSDDAVSWRHCSLEPSAEGTRVRDLGSHNGTYLDGRRIESVLAEAGSRIQVGQTSLRLTGESEPTDREEAAGLAELVGRSAAMQEVYARIEEAAAGRIPVLILGETGTGKELAARAVHSVGPRSLGPFVPINCAAIPRELMEEELFGHARGAFTGATGDRAGAFERADGGTIFLDEVGELPPELQSKLLRVLEDGVVQRLGGGTTRCDFRVVAATNSDLAAAMSERRFRQDLFYRLAVLQIRLPPLRGRAGDLPELVGHFLESAEQQTGVPGAARISFEADALRRLAEHSWPGNVRELRNLVFRSVFEVKRGTVDQQVIGRLLADLAVPEINAPATSGNLQEIEREVIRKALQDCSGQRRAAARRLGIAESTLYEKINRYGLGDVGR